MKASPAELTEADRTALVERYWPAARRWALGWYGFLKREGQLDWRISQDDAESGAAFGLLRAARRYNPARGLSFATYARPLVLLSCVDTVRELFGRPWSAKYRGLQTKHGTFGASEYGDDEPRFAEPLDRLADDPADVAAASDLADHLIAASSGKVRDAARLYWLGGLTMKATGRRLGLSESRICQMLQEARDAAARELAKAGGAT